MRKLLAGSIIMLSVIAACSDSTSSDHPVQYGVTPTIQWSGGSITGHSIAFHGVAVPVVYGAGSPLPVSRIDDTTVAIRLPVGPSGGLVLSRDAAGHDTVGVVHVVGLNRHRDLPVALGYEPLVPEGLDHVLFVAESMGGSAQALTLLDPATDQATYLHGLGPVQSSFGVQPGFLSNSFVLRDSSGTVDAWELFPSPSALRSVSVAGSPRHISQLNDSTWLSTFSHFVTITVPTATRYFQNLVNDPLRIVFSPDGSRVAMVLSSAQNSAAPVLDAVTGDTAFSVDVQEPRGVAFSRLADRLFVSAHSDIPAIPDSLISVVASDGQPILRVALPAGYRGYALAADPKADRLYQVADSSGTQALLVYDGPTLALLGRLQCPGTCGDLNYIWSAGIGVDTLTGQIHVAFPAAASPSTSVITYDRLP